MKILQTNILNTADTSAELPQSEDLRETVSAAAIPKDVIVAPMPATASSPPVVPLDDTAADDERLDRLGALPGYDDDDDSDDALGARVDGRRANSSTLHNCLGETVTRQFESCTDSELRRLRRRTLRRVLRGHPPTSGVPMEVLTTSVASAAAPPHVTFENRVRELGLTRAQGVALLNSPGGRGAIWGHDPDDEAATREAEEHRASIRRRQRIDRMLHDISLKQPDPERIVAMQTSRRVSGVSAVNDATPPPRVPHPNKLEYLARRQRRHQRGDATLVPAELPLPATPAESPADPYSLEGLSPGIPSPSPGPLRVRHGHRKGRLVNPATKLAAEKRRRRELTNLAKAQGAQEAWDRWNNPPVPTRSQRKRVRDSQRKQRRANETKLHAYVLRAHAPADPTFPFETRRIDIAGTPCWQVDFIHDSGCQLGNMLKPDIGQHIVDGDRVIDCGTFGSTSVQVHGGNGFDRFLQTRDGRWIRPVTRKGDTSAPTFTGKAVNFNLLGAEAERAIGLHSHLNDDPYLSDLHGNEFPLQSIHGKLVSRHAIPIPRDQWTDEEQDRMTLKATVAATNSAMEEANILLAQLPDEVHDEAIVAKRVLEERLQRLHAAVDALVVDSAEIIANTDALTQPQPYHTVSSLTADDDEALRRLIANNALSTEEKRLLNIRNKTRDADAFGDVAPWLSTARINDEVASMHRCEENQKTTTTTQQGQASARSTTQPEQATARVTENRPGPPIADTGGAVGRVRSLPAELRAHMSTIAGRKEPVISAPARIAEKDRAALPLGTWVVDAYVGGAASGSRYGHEYYLRFVCKATGKRRTYGCTTKKAFVEALRLHVRWCRSVAPLTERKHGFAPGTLDIRVLASDMDSNFGTIRGAVRSAFDDLVVARGLLRYVTTKGDSSITGTVEATFPSMREVSAIMVRAGANKEYFSDAVAFHDQVHGQLKTSSNKYGKGESPDSTLGLQDIRKFLMPFFCPCTVDVSHMGLAVADDGSITKLSDHGSEVTTDAEGDPEPDRVGEQNLRDIVDQQGHLVGRVKAIKRLGGFMLAVGGGMDASWNGSSFPGYKVLVPALKKKEDPNSGITTSHHVRFWPELKPLRNQQSGFPCDVTMRGALADPKSSNGCALVSPRRFGALSVEELSEEYHALESKLREAEERDNKEMGRDTCGYDEEAAATGILAPSLEDDEPVDPLVTIDDVPASTIRRINDGMSGQGVYERPGKSRRPSYGYCAGKRVKLLSESAVDKIISKARQSRSIFQFNPHHIKSGASGPRYEIYRGIRTWDDYDRMCKERMVDTGEAVIKHEDLTYDVARGILQFHPRSILAVEELEESQSFVMYIEDDGQMRSVYCKKPQYHRSPSKDVMYHLKRRLDANGITNVSGHVLALLSEAVFEMETIHPDTQQRYVVAKSLKEAMKSPDWESKWLPAIMKEIDGLEARGVWKRVPRSQVPRGTIVLPSHLVFDVKYDAAGNYLKHKARLVAQGNRSRYGMHYFESSSQVMHSASAKLMASISTGEWGRAIEEAKKKRGAQIDVSEFDYMKVHTIDVSQAYTIVSRDPADPQVYMELPKGIDQDDQPRAEYVALMQKMLYGEKSAGRAWMQYLDRFLRKRFGAVPIVADRCVYQVDIQGHHLVIGTFVDDISYFGTSQWIIDYFLKGMREHFGEDQVTGGTVVNSLLGIKFDYDDEELTLKLSMPGFITKTAEEFGLEHATPTPTSLPQDVKDEKHNGPVDPHRRELFQRMVGCLQWAAQQCCPWISKGVHQISRHTHNPSEEHVRLAKHCIRHLLKDINKGIMFHGSEKVLGSPFQRRFKLISYVDANLDGDAWSEHSLGAYVIQLNGGPIMVKVMKQTRISRSTGHSEMQALCLLGQALSFCSDWLTEMGYGQETCTVYEDNSSCVIQSAGDHQSSKSAHYRRDQATVEELVRSGKMWVQHCPSHLNVADIGTKIVKPISQYEFLTDKLAGYDTDLHMSHEMQKLINSALVVMPIESVDALLAYTRSGEQGR